MNFPVLPEILVYYNIDDFFDLSSIESMYRSDQDLDQSGTTTLDNHALTNNEQEFFNLLLKRAASKAYEKLQVFQTREANEFWGEKEPDFKRSWGWNSLPEITVAELNLITDPVIDLHYTVTGAGILTLGSVTVAVNDIVYFDGTDWHKDNTSTLKYIFYYLSLPVGFDKNNIYVLDDTLKEFIVLFVVKEWFKRQRYSLDLIMPEFETISNELGRIINYRRSTSRKTRTF